MRPLRRSAHGGTRHAEKKQGVTFEQARELLLTPPGMEEGTAFGTPALRGRKKFIVRFHEDGESATVTWKPEWGIATSQVYRDEVLQRSKAGTFIGWVTSPSTAK